MQQMHCVPNNQKAYTLFLATENNKKILRCENLADTTCRILEKVSSLIYAINSYSLLVISPITPKSLP